MNFDDDTIDTKGLEKLIKAMKVKPPVARVGVLGSKPREGGSSNADIGAKHEFGSPSEGLPQRSFLRVPLNDNLEKFLDSSGAFDKDAMESVIKLGTFLPWIRKMAIVAEKVVAEAFASGGFGKWAPHSPGYTNNTGQILVDTQQLRNSITSEVKG